jgi:hypothetical protein
MRFPCYAAACAVLALQAVWAEAGPLLPGRKEPAPLPASIPWQDLNDQSRGLLLAVVEKPTLAARGPAETFTCKPAQYLWLLDHPDRAVTAWRRLCAKCVSITPRGEGQFGWTDENGSEVIWQTVCKTGGVRVWYAEGKVRPGPVMPLVPVKALLVLTHVPSQAADGNSTVEHRSELFLQTDNRAATALTKMMGTSAQRIAEQGLTQLQLFFSALSWYVDRHPDRAEALLRSDE